MPSIIVVKHTDNKLWAGASNPTYPAPDWKANVNITVDISGLMMFDRAAMGVALTGVMNVNSGKVSLTAVIPRQAEVEHNIGGFSIGRFFDKKKMAERTMVRGPETEAFNPRAMPSPKAMKVLGVKSLTPIDHENQASSSPVNLGTSHEQLAKDAEGIDRNVGKSEQVPDSMSYIGFTITKWEGSEVWPHEIIYRSGTFNQRFVKGAWASPAIGRG